MRRGGHLGYPERGGAGPRRGRTRQRMPNQEYIADHAGAPPATNVNFTVQVPFDIAEGMGCRAMYYEDEQFYDATVVRKSRTGWLVSFAGFPGEPLQDTEVADILSLPAATGQPAVAMPQVHQHPSAMHGPRGPLALDPNAAPFLSPSSIHASKEGMESPMALHEMPQGRGQHGKNVQSLHERKGPLRSNANRRRGKREETSIPHNHMDSYWVEAGALAEGMICKGLYYGDGLGMYYDAVLVRQSRSGWFLSFVGFEHEEPQDTVESDIVFANWAECKAMFYDEKKVYVGYRGPRTAQGYLVGFQGFELDPCQDTREEDIVMLDGSSKQKGKQDRQQKPKKHQENEDGKGEKKQGANPQTPSRQNERRADKAKAPESPAHPPSGESAAEEAGNSTPSARGGKQTTKVTKPKDCVVHAKNLDPAVTRQQLFTFCTKTVGLMPLSVHILSVRNSKDTEGAGSSRGVIVFDTAQDAQNFLSKAHGHRFKGRKPFFLVKREASGAKPEAAQHKTDEGGWWEEEEGVEHADAEQEGETGDGGDEAKVQLGSLYEAMIGAGAGFLSEEGSKKEVEETGIVFGMSLTSCSDSSQRIALHVLREDGGSTKTSELQGRRLLIKSMEVAIAVPTHFTFLERMHVRQSLLLKVPGLSSCKLHMVDSMTAAAVEFVDGWYSNVYDVAGMEVLLLESSSEVTAIGLARVGPKKADVLHTEEAMELGEDRVLEEVSRCLAEEVEGEVDRLYNFKCETWTEEDMEDLRQLAQEVIRVLSQREEAHVTLSFSPSARDTSMQVDLRVSRAQLVEMLGKRGTVLASLERLASRLISQAGEQGEVKLLRGVAPVGASHCGALLGRLLAKQLGISPDNIHMFLQDSRNVAAGAARTVLWEAPAGGKEESQEEGERVARRCRVPYSCAVLHTAEEPSKSEAIIIPWTAMDRELPLTCTVNDLDNVANQDFIISYREGGRVLACLPLAGSDEVTITIDRDGCLSHQTRVGGDAVESPIKLEAPNLVYHTNLEAGSIVDMEVEAVASSLSPILQR